MMKVLYIIGDFTQTLVDNLQRVFRNNGDRIDKFCYSTRHFAQMPEPKWHDYIYNNPLHMHGPIFLKARMKYVLSALLNNSMISSEKYDVVHAHIFSLDGILAYNYHLKYNIPYVISVRNTDINFYQKTISPYVRNYRLKVIKNAKAITFPCVPYVKKLLESLDEDTRKVVEPKCRVIPNGIAPFWLDNTPEAPSPPPCERKLTILTVGEVNKNKNMLTVARAVQKLIGEGFEVEYRIAGKAVNKRIAKKLGGYSFITMLGKLGKQDLLNEYRRANVYVLVSKHETFGLCYPEALSQGLPIVYSAGEGFDGQTEEGTVGYSCNYKDFNAVAGAIKDIVSDYSRLAHNALRVSKEYSWEKIAKLFYDVYR